MKEIEKKYLVEDLPIDYDKHTKLEIEQTYIYISDVCDIRVRKIQKQNGACKYIHTIKINYRDTMTYRDEFETEIDETTYNKLLLNKFSNTNVVRKTRYLYPLGGGLKAEIDLYKDELEGLKTAEVEFSSLYELDFFTEPDWFLEDITEDEKYKNKSLCINENKYKKVMKK